MVNPARVVTERLPNMATIQALKRAEERMLEAKFEGRTLAVDVLDEFMQMFAKRARSRKPMLDEDGKDTNPLGDKEDFDKYAQLAVTTAAQLAKYQSPTFRAIVVAPPPPAPKSGEDNTRRFTLKIFDGGRQVNAVASPLAAQNGHGPGNGSGPVEIDAVRASEEE